MIRVGVLGCASIARRSLAPAFMKHKGFQLVAVASRSYEKAKAFIATLEPSLGKDKSKELYPLTYDELINSSDIDLIYCPLPTGMHFEWVGKSLKAGKHVLCEKSLASNLKEVEHLISLAREHRRFLMESFQFRFHAQNLYVKDLLARNSIGPLRQVVVRFGIPPFPDGASNIRYSAELGGGALLDNGAYTVKCATYLLGYDIDVLAAMIGGHNPSLGNVDLTGSIMMRAGDVAIQTSYGFDHFYQNSYEIWGKDGKISTVRAFTAREDFAAPVILETKNGRNIKEFNDDHFARLLDYVYREINSGTFDREYCECLSQARTLELVAKVGGIR